MSLDLFSSMDFYYPKFSFLSIFSFILSMSLILIFFFMKKSFSNLNSALYSVNNLMKQKFSFILKFKVGNILLLLSIFFFMCMSKMAGLFPFVFGWTAHMILIMQMSLFFWLLMKLNSMKLKFMAYFSHYTPQGVPLVLGLFLAKIELMSKIIRPLTLSLRLGMNMTTGHMLLALISVMGVSSGAMKFFMLMLATFYFFFELFVMLMQAIVYSLLLSQYFEEYKKT